MTEKEVGAWDDYIDVFLKATNVKDENESFVCVGVVENKNEDKKNVRLELERGDEVFSFDLNKTNTLFIKDSGIVAPSKCIGKKFYFKKVNVTNPQTRLIVESLRIHKIE